MKRSAGSAVQIVVVALLLLWAPVSSARLVAKVDRVDIALGETLRLTLIGDAGERPDEVDLAALERDFNILDSSTATNARLVNGDQSITRTLELELAPLREGLVTIPSFSSGGRSSTPIAIKVSAAPDIDAGDARVLFDSEVDRTSVYVQAQLLLTVTLQQAMPLDQRDVTPPVIPGAQLEMLEQRSFQRQLNGRLWQVIELRYAVFPQQSGTLVIPEFTFTGREVLPGRSLLGARLGRRIAINTQPISVEVKPVPSSFPGDVWLPARKLEVSELWSKPPESLVLGDSSTRTFQLSAKGLLGSTLPPVNSLDAGAVLDGLRFYPGEERIDQTETAAGLTGQRQQSEALVPSQPGSWQLPERVIPWWNTESDRLEYARIPGRRIEVRPTNLSNDTITDATLPSALEGKATVHANPWLIGTAAAGWLLALGMALVLWRQGRQPNGQASSSVSSTDPESLRRALVALRLACQQNDPAAARKALLAWGHHRYSIPISNLNHLSTLTSSALATQIEQLNAALYGKEGVAWQGQSLFDAARDDATEATAKVVQTPSLYPAA